MNLGAALLTTARDQPLNHLDTFATSLDAALVTRVSKLRRKSVSGGLQTWHILKNSGPDALETPLSSLKLG